MPVNHARNFKTWVLRGAAAVRCQAAFTRMDLAATICVFAALSLWAAAAVSRHAEPGNGAACAGNARQLTLAWQMYAHDYGRALPSSHRNLISFGPFIPEWSGLTGGDYSVAGGGASPGWLDLPIVRAGNIDPSQSVEKSPLAPYLREGAATWKCPSDMSGGALPEVNEGRWTPRVRTYSMNGWLGLARGSGWTPGYRTYQTIDDLVDPGPADTLALLDEREDSVNDGYFVIDMDGYVDGGDVPSRQTRVVNFPGFYHARGSNVAFADGHVALRQWRDPRTLPELRPNQELALDVLSPNNADVLWLQERATRRGL